MIENMVISSNADFDAAERQIFNNTFKSLLVVDDNNSLFGVMEIIELDRWRKIGGGDGVVGDYANINPILVYDYDNINEKCLKLFYTTNVKYIPVISKERKIIDLIIRNQFLQLRMLSYTDPGEDVVLNFVLRDLKDVFYIDIGANDPWFGSVTKWLYSSGRGKGINIEPLKREYSLLCKDRPKDVNLNIAVGSEECEMILYSNFGLSTFIKDYTLIENKPANRFSPIKVPVTTLKLICDKYLEKNQEVHFLKIDVEGFEKQVLLGSDFKKFRPWIIMLEATKPCTRIPTYAEWENILIENDYVFAKQYDINRFYVSKEKSFLQDRFLDLEIIYRRLLILDAKSTKYQLHI